MFERPNYNCIPSNSSAYRVLIAHPMHCHFAAKSNSFCLHSETVGALYKILPEKPPVRSINMGTPDIKCRMDTDTKPQPTSAADAADAHIDLNHYRKLVRTYIDLV